MSPAKSLIFPHVFLPGKPRERGCEERGREGKAGGTGLQGSPRGKPGVREARREKGKGGRKKMEGGDRGNVNGGKEGVR